MRHLLLALSLAVVTIGGFWAFQSSPQHNQDITVIIPRNTTLFEIAHILEDKGAVRSSLAFVGYAVLTGNALHLKAGEYFIPAGLSWSGIVQMMAEGRVVRHRLTIPEGASVAQVIAWLNEIDVLEGEVGVPPPEGSLWPATYDYVHGDNRAHLLASMQKKMTRHLQKLWEDRSASCPIASPEQALILASIVEKETAVPAERARIAGVFYNRLTKGMRLQSDPTVIYGITLGKPLGRALTTADLQATTPHNTYTQAGLPPTPIACPGKASLEAVLHPEKTEALYFVADGSGGHAFSETYKTHTRHVSHWRAFNRQANGPPPSADHPDESRHGSPASSGS